MVPSQGSPNSFDFDDGVDLFILKINPTGTGYKCGDILWNKH